MLFSQPSTWLSEEGGSLTRLGKASSGKGALELPVLGGQGSQGHTQRMKAYAKARERHGHEKQDAHHR